MDMGITSIGESVRIAVNSIRGAKVRAGLTILGVAIGVTAVMAIAALVQGINQGVADALNQLGEETFFLMRHFGSGIEVHDGSTPEWANRPKLEVADAEAIRRLDSIRLVTYRSSDTGTAIHKGERATNTPIVGTTEDWAEIDGGEMIDGRNFTDAEDRAGSAVAVVNEALVRGLFPTGVAVGKEFRVSGINGNVRLRVIGVYREPPSAFQQLGENQAWLVVPYETLARNFRTFPDAFGILIKPQRGVPQEEAIDEVIALMRQRHSLRPGQQNDFDVVPQAKLLEGFKAFTGTFFLVMIALASIGLMVGGVGVIGIMMIAVTERTREVGVRRAAGAKRAEILVQFLVEAVLLTLVGAIVGMFAGWGIARLVAALSPIPAAVPVWAVVAAVAASAATGVGFGLYPALRASRLDPVAALRYE
jgi:putative ABC transport system permease protein